MTHNRFIAFFTLLILISPAAYSQRERTVTPKAPDYKDATMWITADEDPGQFQQFVGRSERDPRNPQRSESLVDLALQLR